MLSGCGVSDVNTGGSNTSTTKNQPTDEKKTDNEKRFNANATTTVLGVTVNVAEIKMTPERIEVGINLQNTGKQKVTYYPDQGAKILIGDMQLESNMFMSTGKIGGEIESGIKQDAVLVFLAPEGKKLDVATIKQFKLKLDEIMSGDFMNTKEVAFDIVVK